MRNTLYAAIAATLAMLATSGIVALATAAPSEPYDSVASAEQAMMSQLDLTIARHLQQVQHRLLAGEHQ